MKQLHQLMRDTPFKWNEAGSLGVRLTGISCDSRKVRPGDLFIALPGVTLDGHRFIKEAIMRGAKAIISEQKDLPPEVNYLPQLTVSSSRRALAMIAATWNEFPSKQLRCIGVTGTNGKTTTALLIQYLLQSTLPSGFIGSIYYDTGRQRYDAQNTTPGPLQLHELLAQMERNELKGCVMEVSSHALDQGRVAGIHFSSAVFLNLTRDHLDYHRNYESYYQAKRRLFTSAPAPQRAIVNGDNIFGKRLIHELGAKNVISTGLDPEATYNAREVRQTFDTVEFDLLHQGERHVVRAPLGLRYNVHNVLAALAVAVEEGIPKEQVIAKMTTFPGVCGRMERMDKGHEFRIYVDYAHTPDALLSVLSAASNLRKNRIITVFGCGGDRDREKRPQMGKIAAEFSDIVVITSDNPRTEDPRQIIKEVREGMNAATRRPEVIEEVDRKGAIQTALNRGANGDIVFVFGKGHEQEQVIGQQRIALSDQEVIADYLGQNVYP